MVATPHRDAAIERFAVALCEQTHRGEEHRGRACAEHTETAALIWPAVEKTLATLTPARREQVGIATTDVAGYFGRPVRLYQRMAEGYPTGEYVVDHLTRDLLQQFADWCLTLPEPVYAPLASVHRMVEHHLLPKDNRR